MFGCKVLKVKVAGGVATDDLKILAAHEFQTGANSARCS